MNGGVFFLRRGTVKQRITTLCAGGLLALALLRAQAGPLEDARAAFVKGDYAQAFPLYRKAADQGNAEAQLFVGLMYRDGQGVPQDYAQAIVWFLKVAVLADDAANPPGLIDLAQLNLGRMYRDGHGVPQDYLRAHMWLNLAASHAGLGRNERDDLAAKMTPDQIAEAQRMAREWKPK